jgi:OOP family OmpA-OmpF porin
VQADGDNDGVVDELDQCPDTSEGLPVDSSGCDTLSGAIDGVNFESGSDKLTAGAQQRLAEVAQTLNQYTEIRVAVAAHTDNQGSAESNLQLSKRRAIAVARYLVEQGVAGNRLRPQAYGESQPLTSNATASGRATNRRVELQVVQ